MAKGIYAALSGAVMAESALALTAQNLSNASSAGFQKLRPVFREVLTEQTNRPGQPERPGSNRFAAIANTSVDTTPGVIRSTGRGLDVVLPEGSYLAVNNGGGERYTRAGSLQLDAQGQLRAAGGVLVDENQQPISVPLDKELTITSDGQIMAGDEAVGRLRIVSFEDASQLSPEGAALYRADAAAAATVSDVALKTGAIEESNVSTVGSMTELMTVTRLFDAFKSAIDTFNDADRRIAGVHGQ